MDFRLKNSEGQPSARRRALEFNGGTGSETSERVHAFAQEPDVVVIPSHDSDAHRAAGFIVTA